MRCWTEPLGKGLPCFGEGMGLASEPLSLFQNTVKLPHLWEVKNKVEGPRLPP